MINFIYTAIQIVVDFLYESDTYWRPKVAVEKLLNYFFNDDVRRVEIHIVKFMIQIV